jgi:hypothetical protein
MNELDITDALTSDHHFRKGMLQRFIFAVFSKGPPATNRESPEGRGEGCEGFSPSSSGLFL